jgi:hypothetical protein
MRGAQGARHQGARHVVLPVEIVVRASTRRIQLASRREERTRADLAATAVP